MANARVVRTHQGPPGRPARRRPGRDAAAAAGRAATWAGVNRVRLGRDYYVRVDSNDYSVDPAVIGRFVDVTADLAPVEVRLDGRLRRRPTPGSGRAA